jgi:hypothetical protein
VFALARAAVEQKFRAPINWTVTEFTSPAVADLRRAVNHPLCGALVFWGPFASGKTFALKDLTKKLQDEGKIIIYLNGKDYRRQNYQMFSLWLRASIGLTANANGLEEYFPFKEGTITTIIIDHFDDLMNVPDARPLVVGLARESREKKRFNILVGVSSAANARAILLWNGNSKITLACRPDAARWDANMTRLFALGSAFVQALGERDASDVVEYASTCGSPGKVEELASFSGRIRKRLAETIMAEWEAGNETLSQCIYFD